MGGRGDRVVADRDQGFVHDPQPFDRPAGSPFSSLPRKRRSSDGCPCLAVSVLPRSSSRGRRAPRAATDKTFPWWDAQITPPRPSLSCCGGGRGPGERGCCAGPSSGPWRSFGRGSGAAGTCLEGDPALRSCTPSGVLDEGKSYVLGPPPPPGPAARGRPVPGSSGLRRQMAEFARVRGR